MATVHFIHIGDVHMAPGARNDDRRRAMRTIVDENINDPLLGAWLLPGDLNHARMSIEDRNWLADILREMANAAPVIICYGNHDLPGDLDVFARLQTNHGIVVVSTPSLVSIPLATGHAASAFVLPYPTKAGLVSAGVAHNQLVDTAADALEAIFRNGVAKLEQRRSAGDVTLFLGHVNIGGSLLSNGQPNIGVEIELNAGLLAMFGDCYKGASHIHKAQEVGGAYYPGSVCRLDYGEVDPKGYIVVAYESYENENGSRRWRYVVTRRPLAVAPIFHVDGALTPQGFRLADGTEPEAERRWHAGEWAGCEVRVRYTVLQAERAAVDEAVVQRDFATADRLKLECIVVRDQGVRAPEVARAQNLHDKAIAWCRVAGIEPTDSLLDKLAQLEHAEGQAVLTTVTRQLAGEGVAHAA